MPDPQPAEVVYVLGTPGSSVVKIGRSTNLAKRVADIQRMSPVPLAVLWTCPGGSELETNLHRHFKTVRSHGEWFTFATDPLPLIRAAVETEPWLQPAQQAATPARHERLTIASTRPVYDQALLARQKRNVAEARVALIAQIEAIPDPMDRLKALARIEARLTEGLASMKQEAVLGLKVGRTWRSVGELIGVSGARAEQISRRSR